MMGTFHTIMTFLAVVAARFKDAGLRDIVVQSGLVAEVSLNTMFTRSRAYKRAARVYKILYEAFSRMLFEKFEENYPETSTRMQNYLETMDKPTDFNNFVSSKELQDYSTNLITYKAKILVKLSGYVRYLLEYAICSTSW